MAYAIRNKHTGLLYTLGQNQNLEWLIYPDDKYYDIFPLKSIAEQVLSDWWELCNGVNTFNFYDYEIVEV